jgi:flagellar FliJ protein
MPRFTFKLEAALRKRKLAEREAQRVLATRLAHANSLDDTLAGLNRDLVGAAKALRDGRLVGTVDVAYLTAHRRYTNDVARRGQELLAKRALAEREVVAARTDLAEAARQRIVLDKLRERQHARWREAQARREQADADEAAGVWFAEVSREPEPLAILQGGER